MPNLIDPNLTAAYARDRELLAETELPIITVAGSFREDIKQNFGLLDNNSYNDVVLSRAHFSMALGVATEAWGEEMSPRKAWIADPTNYVSPKQWQSVQLTEAIGKTLARNSFLKAFKDFIDQFGRSKLPILDSITPPLLYLTEKIDKPILCFHIAAGNILVKHGKSVIQVVTDPQVRPEYVKHADNPKMRFCVFDDATKLEFLEVAAIHKIAVNPDKIIVTGPPIDPRIVAARTKKTAWRSGPVKLCIATGGLGTNKYEIRKVLQQILPHLRRQPIPYQVVIYAGTQKDIAQMAKKLAQAHHIAIGAVDDEKARLRILYHRHIVEANELLIRFGFPWADGFLTKPSGDMAYDAVAAGCFLLTLQEWGVWETKIREIFEQKEIARRAQPEHIVEQLDVLRGAQYSTSSHKTSWIEQAMNRAFGIEKLFLLGSKKIVKVATDASRAAS